MKKQILIIFSFIVVLSFLYLNRAYSHIYQTIDHAGLRSPSMKSSYEFGNLSQESKKYIAVGDSLTSGVGVDSFEESYPYQVAEKFSKEVKSVSLKIFAVPGAKTKDILLSLDSIIQLKPDIITIFIGVNDVHGNVSIKDFQKNYQIILTRLTEETDADVYVVSIPYIGDDTLILRPYSYYFNQRSQKFNKVIKELSDELSLVYVDLYNRTLEFVKQDSYYSSDLFHPSSIGYTRWSEIIYDNFNQ